MPGGPGESGGEDIYCAKKGLVRCGWPAPLNPAVGRVWEFCCRLVGVATSGSVHFLLMVVTAPSVVQHSSNDSCQIGDGHRFHRIFPDAEGLGVILV